MQQKTNNDSCFWERSLEICSRREFNFEFLHFEIFSLGIFKL